jgi:hypothetical protein
VIRALAGLLLIAAAVPASAQIQQPPPSPPPPAPAHVEFLSRYVFGVGLDHLSRDEPRYVWDATFGGDLDMVDYGAGRATFTATYETILGEEYRAFDPNQGNYTLEGSVTARTRAGELAGVFHHVSRHLSDRPKRFPIDWNMIGGRFRHDMTFGQTAVHTRADLRGVIEHTYVDYRWEAEGAADARVQLRPKVALIADGTIRVLGVDGSRNRGTQTGFRGEGGVRLFGRGAVLDLLIAAERRVDPYQLEFGTITWLATGFRISSVP